MHSQTRPNILIFVMDTQPVRNMTPYGYEKPTTPNLEKIAREGLVYDNHYVTGCWTVPVHASLFSGKYQTGHWTGTQHEFMSPRFPTMGEVLTSAGYQTVAFSNNTWVNQDKTNIGRGFEKFVLVERPSGQNPQIGPEDDFVLYDEVDAGSSKTVELIQRWLQDERDDERPFFLFVNCVEPHLRAWAPQPFRSAFLLDGVTDDEARGVNQDIFAERLGIVPDRPDGYMTEQDWTILKSLYDGETACLDQRMGLLFDHMRSLGLLDDTLLIVVSDHGDLLDRKGMMGHHLSLFDDLIHTPLIVRWPGVVPPGARFDGFVQVCDWFPTFLEVLDLGIMDDGVLESIGAEMQGVSLVPTWDDRTVREFAVAEYMKPLQTIERALRHQPDFDYRRWLRRWKSICTAEFKYHWASDGPDMLFNMVADPGERVNLIDKMPDTADSMRRKLENFLISLSRNDFGDEMRNHGFRNVRWDNVDRLKAWGIYRDVSHREA
jgi:arylsulfatase A-like enzyme